LGIFYRQIAAHPPAFDTTRAKQTLGDLKSAAGSDDALKELVSLVDGEEKVRALLASIFGSSPYLTGLIIRDPACLQECLACETDTYLDELGDKLVRGASSEESQKDVMARLRDYKRQIALFVGLADIAGVLSIEQVTQALSDAADRSISSAVRYLLARPVKSGELQVPEPAKPEQGSGYFVLGMGKLGAYELNYSSDIDLIVFFDAGVTRLREGSEPAPFFVRLTRDLVRLLQDRTADGYVWRTDLRLRPDPGATQLALSTDAGLSYYESFGQNWERAALIKARVVAGDKEAGEAFLAQLSPFIWRRYLDFAAVADIHAMKRRVHEFKGHARIAVAGHDIKLGRGGIREIEFFTQTQQLIAGGRQRELRTPETLVTLRRLADQGWIDDEACEGLSEAYRFLRTVEHRLQMIADEQTHKLPSGAQEVERVACFCGYADVEAFSAALVERLTRVQKYYDQLFARLPAIGEAGEEREYRPDDELPETLAALRESGFNNPDAVVEMIRGWRAGRYAATRSQRARECLSEIQPKLLEALSDTADPDTALVSFDRFVSELPAGVQLFSLLRSNTNLLQLIANIMGTAPRLARVLSRRSRILDAVLDPSFFGELPKPEMIEQHIEEELSQAFDYQDCLDRARRVGHEQSFLIGVRILSGTVTADQAGRAYAGLAQSMIRALHAQVEKELARQHGVLKGGESVVIAMGKLGSQEMTAASDLDLIIVYDFDEDATMSDGARPLAGGQYYSRVTQRLISALSAQTAEGSLYEVDMRLRPSGHSGPVATQFSGFVEYQREKAWTWEHLALTRARVVSGPAHLVQGVEETIRDVLTTRRDRRKVANDVLEMRARIEKEKGTLDIWDIKNVSGGLVDLEFIAQFLQIVSAHEHPEVLDQNTATAFEKLSGASLLEPADAQILIRAAHLYHNLTQIVRLCLESPISRDTASCGLKGLLAKAAGLPDFDAVEEKLAQTMKSVRQAYVRLVA
jgi:glutamate-ammonia-ligase adenylyltransferase